MRNKRLLSLTVLILIAAQFLNSSHYESMDELLANRSYFSVEVTISTDENLEEVARIYKGTILETEASAKNVQTFVLCGVDAKQKKNLIGGLFGPVADPSGNLYWGIRRSYFRDLEMDEVQVRVIALCDNLNMPAPSAGTTYFMTTMTDKNYVDCDQGIHWNENREARELLCEGKEASGIGPDYKTAIENAILFIFKDLEQDRAINISQEDLIDFLAQEMKGNIHVSCYSIQDCRLENIRHFSDKESTEDKIKVTFIYNLRILKADLISKFETYWVQND